MSTARLEAVEKNNHPGRNTRPGNTRVPTPAEVREARAHAKLTQEDAAAKVRGSVEAWRKWESDSRTENRRMHPGLFELFLIKTGQPVPAWLSGS